MEKVIDILTLSEGENHPNIATAYMTQGYLY
jgi:hypothetical protein